MWRGMIASGNNVALGKIINGILSGIRTGEKYTKNGKMERTA